MFVIMDSKSHITGPPPILSAILGAVEKGELFSCTFRLPLSVDGIAVLQKVEGVKIRIQSKRCHGVILFSQQSRTVIWKMVSNISHNSDCDGDYIYLSSSHIGAHGSPA